MYIYDFIVCRCSVIVSCVLEFLRSRWNRLNIFKVSVKRLLTFLTYSNSVPAALCHT